LSKPGYFSKSGHIQISDRLRQAANDKYFKRRVNNFLQKLNLATKPQRHKRKCYAFFCFVPLRLRGNRFSQQSGEKIILIVISKELKKIYDCLRWQFPIQLTFKLRCYRKARLFLWYN